MMLCAECGHEFEHHGDRAVAACAPGISFFYCHSCDCSGWQPSEPPC